MVGFVNTTGRFQLSWSLLYENASQLNTKKQVDGAASQNEWIIEFMTQLPSTHYLVCKTVSLIIKCGFNSISIPHSIVDGEELVRIELSLSWSWKNHSVVYLLLIEIVAWSASGRHRLRWCSESIWVAYSERYQACPFKNYLQLKFTIFLWAIKSDTMCPRPSPWQWGMGKPACSAN